MTHFHLSILIRINFFCHQYMHAIHSFVFIFIFIPYTHLCPHICKVEDKNNCEQVKQGSNKRTSQKKKSIQLIHYYVNECIHAWTNERESIFRFPIVIIVVAVYQQFSLSVLITIVCPPTVANLYSHYGIRSFVEFSFDAHKFSQSKCCKKEEKVFNISEIKSDTYDCIYLYVFSRMHREAKMYSMHGAKKLSDVISHFK